MREYFTESELACPCCGINKVKPSFRRRLNQLRHALGFPLIPSSAFRCRQHNEDVGGGVDSAHLAGRGIDFPIARGRAFRMVEEAQKLGFTGIGLRQKGDTDERFIHLDDLLNEPHRPRPTIWTY